MQFLHTLHALLAYPSSMPVFILRYVDSIRLIG